MKLAGLIEALRAKWVKKAAYGVLGVLIAVDFFIPRPHEIHFFGDNVPGFWSAFGLAACVVIIVASKWIGHHGLMKDEDYYDR